MTAFRQNRARNIAPVALCLVVAACSVERTAVNIVGNAVTGGNSVYASDDDPHFVREALPFGLKTFEGLLAVSPEHRGLLLASARGYSAYAYLLMWEADRIEESDLTNARAIRARAHRHYLRGRDYAFRGLEINQPNFRHNVVSRTDETLAAVKPDEVAFLYWAGAAWAGALTAARDDLDLIAELPVAGAIVSRVLEIDESYDQGAAHEFFVSYEAGRPGGSTDAAREHYRKAVDLAGGQRASVHVALAESVSVRQQNLAEFTDLLRSAAAVDPAKAPQFRLVNAVAQERAHWLTQRVPQLFVNAGEEARSSCHGC